MSREREVTRSTEDEPTDLDDVLDDETRTTLEVSDTIEETLQGFDKRPISTGTVTGLDETRTGDIIVRIDMPEGERQLVFDAKNDKQELSMFLDDVGVTKSNASAAIGQSVPAVYIENEWHYHVPDTGRGLLRRLYDADLVTVEEASKEYKSATWTKTRRGKTALWAPALVLLSLFLLNLFPVFAMSLLFFWVFGTLGLSDALENVDITFKETDSSR